MLPPATRGGTDSEQIEAALNHVAHLEGFGDLNKFVRLVCDGGQIVRVGEVARRVQARRESDLHITAFQWQVSNDGGRGRPHRAHAGEAASAPAPIVRVTCAAIAHDVEADQFALDTPVVVVVALPLCLGCGCQEFHAGSVADGSDGNVRLLWITSRSSCRHAYDPAMRHPSFVAVDGVVPTDVPGDPSPLDNLRDGVWSFALDQRAFGPGKLWVVFADEDGTFRGLAYTDRTDPLDLGFDACLQYLGAGAAAAIAFCDQPVTDGPPPEDSVGLFERAQAISTAYGIRLVDWIACDDDKFRSHRTPAAPPGELGDQWWGEGL